VAVFGWSIGTLLLWAGFSEYFQGNEGYKILASLVFYTPFLIGILLGTLWQGNHTQKHAIYV
jgi:hypothetical protein